MNPIVYRVGSATRPPERPAVIVHCVNNIGRWGAGFTAALDRDWPLARTTFSQMELGAVRWGRMERALAAHDLWIAHCCGQRGVRSRSNPVPLELAWLKLALKKVAASTLPPDVSFHLPRIGCGLAGGVWEDVEPVVAATLAQRAPTFVYDLEKA